MKKRTLLYVRKLLMLLLAIVLAVPFQVPQAVRAAGETSGYALEDNYYQWKNADLIASKTVSAGNLSWTAFSDLETEIDGKLQEIVDGIIAGKASYASNSDEYQIAELYQQFLDSDARNASGIKAVKPYLKKLQKADTIKKYVKALREIQKEVGFSSLYYLDFDVDSEDVTKYVGFVNTSDLVLDKEMYEDADYAGVRSEFQDYIARMLQYAGTSKKQSKQDAKQIYQMLKKISAKCLSTEEWYDTSKTNRYMTIKQLKKNFPKLQLAKTAKALGIASHVSRYQVPEQEALKVINNLMTKKNLNILKQYSTFIFLNDVSVFLTTDMEDASRAFSNDISGISEREVRTGEAIHFVDGYYGQQLGRMYVKTYFPEETREDIQKMVEELIAAYKERLQNAEWLTESTRNNAIKKLDSMKLNLIAPPEDYVGHYEVKIKAGKDGGVLADTMIKLYQYFQKENLASIQAPPEISVWDTTTPQTVNAFYSPAENSITFPAAIFGGVFYNPERSREENLGGIGVVIGHEISHAFDTSGSQYDEKGNLNNWWTDEDRAAFQQKADKVVQTYNAAKTASGTPGNGSLTITENIADLGGVAVAASLVGDDQEKLQSFFESYANMWACKYASPESEKYYSTVDVHSLAELRVNVVISNIDAFYQAYPQVTSGTAMYVAPEERCAIW